MSRLLCFALLAAALTWAAPAHAQTPPPADGAPVPVEDPNEKRAQELYEQGNTHYDLAEYDQAIDSFKEAYKLSKKPAFIYNIAQAYRQKGDCENALKTYKNYLRLAPDAPNRQKVEQRIAEMQTCIDDPNRKPPGGVDKEPVEVTPPKDEVKPHEDKIVAPPPTGPIDQPPPPPPERRGGSKKIIGLVTAGVGVVALGAGAYFSKIAGDKADIVTEGCANGCDWGTNPTLEQADQDGKDANRNAIIMYSVGGAAVIGGALVYMWGRSDAKASEAPRISVAPVRGGGSVMSMAWTF